MSQFGAIVLVSTSYPAAGDGSEAAGSFVSDFAEALAVHVPVRVVAPGEMQCREVRGSVEVHRYRAPGKPLSTLKPWSITDLRWLRETLRSGRAATQAAVEAGPTAHILALWALPSGHWAWRASRESGVPYSVWTLGSDIWSLGRIPIVRGQLRRVLAGATRCYSDGLKLAEDTRRISGRDVTFLPSTRRIEGGPRTATKDAPPYRLLFLGRWHRNKGVDLLLDALRQLDDDSWRRIAVVEVCGGGPMASVVEAGVAALQAAGRPVSLRGFLAKPQAEAAVAAADFLLVPSRIESIPVVFSDAMKLGAPVVAMPVGDLAQLVDAAPACGVVADAVSAPAFAAALRGALARSPAEFTEGVRDRARHFDLPALAARLLDDLLAVDGGNPRWGNEQRERKANAIWSTLAALEGEAVGDGDWVDIGCGSGGIAHALSTRVRSIVGLDPEPWTAWADLAASRSNLRFSAMRCDDARLPLPPASGDVIVCNQVYEHVGDPQQLIRNIAAALRPGGLCYFAGPNLLWPVEPHVFWPFVHWLPRAMAQRLMGLLGSKHAADLDAHSTHHWRLSRWFREAGLEHSPAIAARLRGELVARGYPRIAAGVPRWLSSLLDHIGPLSPGFVYILRKP